MSRGSWYIRRRPGPDEESIKWTSPPAFCGICGEDIIGPSRRGYHPDCYTTNDLARFEVPPPNMKPRKREE
jgi:hypothetical protein